MDTFVAIDFETADYPPESAISVGVVKFHNYQAVDSLYSLIRPPVLYIRPDFTTIHGLTVADVRDAPPFNAVWEHDLKRFIGDLPLAAHNAAFDIGVLRANFTHYGIEAPPLRYFCTCKLSRRVWTHLRSHALTALARHFNITYNAHNALDDALTCGKLVQLAAQTLHCTDILDVLRTAKVPMAR